MRGIRGFTYFVLIIFFMSFASASFSVGNASNGIESSYGPGEKIRGWINVSLTSEDATSLLESSLGGSIRLIDLVRKTPSNSAFIYSCIPTTCESNYLATNSDVSKTFNLDEEESVLFGMKITATKSVGDISDFYFNLSSNNPGTVAMPLSIDILNDGQVEWQAYAASGEFGAENFGCYVGMDTATQLIANAPQYCERVELSKTPEIELGAYVAYEKGTGTVNFEMSIENSETGEKKVCTVSTSGTGLKRIFCTPTDFSVKEDGDYYVCIKTKLAADNGKYKINSEQKTPCGFTGTYEGDYSYDFEIFARPKEYAASINIKLNDAELARADSPILNVENYIDEYITDNYKNNCSKGCVIPIKVYSGINNQQVDVSNFFMSYIADTYTENTNIYDVEETPAEISSSYQKLFFDDANFSVPTSYGNHTFSVELNDANLLTKTISVGEVAQIKSLTPTKTAVKYPTIFSAEVGGKNITGYNWNFGDGVSETTSVNSVTHTYAATGTYTLKITINSLKGSSSKNFNITVGPASEIVPSLLSDASSSISNIKNQMNSFSLFEQESIDSTLGLSSAEATIDEMNDAVLSAVLESDYEAILAELLTINLPETIAKTATSKGLSFYPATENIDLNVLKEIGGGDYTAGREEQYREAVLAWNDVYTTNDLSYSEISLFYSDRKELLRIFEMNVTKSSADSAYFIIKNMEDIYLQNEDEYSEKTGYFYTGLNGKKSIRFSTTEEVDFVDVPMFISPSLDNLAVLDITPPEKIKWTVPIIIAVMIILIAGVIWVILQVWYIRKYESYLFKDRNHLYNLVSYINDAKKKGESDSVISSKLKKAGWSSEQVRYSLRKYEQKNTGLPEIIPIRKLLEGFKKLPLQKKSTTTNIRTNGS
ncbi:MAG: PKD domain-containing protein [Candidatus Nanoarchaeia archaeon]|nr:PKD domain-containing protein [Candidatus Nanoarchaeia archaeon]MDD5357677.1 PKD domain-containing protein [Candidatus Nanoarchaeia archaeon]MDD5588596.1 PKD domain-containing protein [Candidatus Nanoarchaeia archaeon]